MKKTCRCDKTICEIANKLLQNLTPPENSLKK